MKTLSGMGIRFLQVGLALGLLFPRVNFAEVYNGAYGSAAVPAFSAGVSSDLSKYGSLLSSRNGSQFGGKLGDTDSGQRLLDAVEAFKKTSENNEKMMNWTLETIRNQEAIQQDKDLLGLLPVAVQKAIGQRTDTLKQAQTSLSRLGQPMGPDPRSVLSDDLSDACGRNGAAQAVKGTIAGLQDVKKQSTSIRDMMMKAVTSKIKEIKQSALANLTTLFKKMDEDADKDQGQLAKAPPQNNILDAAKNGGFDFSQIAADKQMAQSKAALDKSKKDKKDSAKAMRAGFLDTITKLATISEGDPQLAQIGFAAADQNDAYGDALNAVAPKAASKLKTNCDTQVRLVHEDIQATKGYIAQDRTVGAQKAEADAQAQEQKVAGLNLRCNSNVDGDVAALIGQIRQTSAPLRQAGMGGDVNTPAQLADAAFNAMQQTAQLGLQAAGLIDPLGKQCEAAWGARQELKQRYTAAKAKVDGQNQGGNDGSGGGQPPPPGGNQVTRGNNANHGPNGLGRTARRAPQAG